MPQMKYIIINNYGLESPFIFSDLEKHSDVAMRLMRNQSEAKVVGAGFCYISKQEYPDGGSFPVFVCFGESISLGVSARDKIDSQLLNRTFGLVEVDF